MTYLFLISVFLINFLPVKDTDFGWHYRCGNEFLTKGILCTSNRFSYFLSDYQAFNPSFLYDIGLGFIYNSTGFIGVSVFGALLMTLCAFLFIKLTRGSLWISASFFYAVLFLSQVVFNLGLRSQIVSYLFILLTLQLLTAKQDHDLKVIFIIPLIIFVWVNTHIGFFMGVVIMGLYTLGELPKIVLKKKFTYGFSLLVMLVISFLITGLNPFGFKVYAEILNHAASPMNKMIAEWVEPPTGHMVILAMVYIGTVILLLLKRRLSFFELLTLSLFFGLSIEARRNLPFFYTYLSLLLINKINLKRVDFLGKDLLIPIFITIILFFAFIQIPVTIKQDTSWNAYCYNGFSNYPCRTLTKFPYFEGNIFANYEWGGFLIWQKPKSKVFIDGRMPAWKNKHGENSYPVFLKILQTQDGWNEKLKSLKTNYILISPNTFLDMKLKRNPETYGWREKHRDTYAVLYENANLGMFNN